MSLRPPPPPGSQKRHEDDHDRTYAGRRRRETTAGNDLDPAVRREQRQVDQVLVVIGVDRHERERGPVAFGARSLECRRQQNSKRTETVDSSTVPCL